MNEKDRGRVADTIRLLVKRFDKHPWDINNGECDDFAWDLVEALGEGAESSWVEDLPDHDYDTDGDIRHVVVMYRGWYFDAEEPYGVKDWRHIPLCARIIRKL